MKQVIYTDHAHINNFAGLPDRKSSKRTREMFIVDPVSFGWMGYHVISAKRLGSERVLCPDVH